MEENDQQEELGRNECLWGTEKKGEMSNTLSQGGIWAQVVKMTSGDYWEAKEEKASFCIFAQHLQMGESSEALS